MPHVYTYEIDDSISPETYAQEAKAGDYATVGDVRDAIIGARIDDARRREDDRRAVAPSRPLYDLPRVWIPTEG